MQSHQKAVGGGFPELLILKVSAEEAGVMGTSSCINFS